METKAELRRRMRLEKQKYTERELSERSERILGQVEASDAFRRAGTVAAYWSLPDEVHTHRFVEKWCTEKTILLPVMCGNGLELRRYTPGCAMNEAAFCLREPEGTVFPPERVELILVPGLAFDRRGNRLGRGKGFYDRLLAVVTGGKIGICFDFQYLETVLADPHDVPVDCVVSG